MAIKFPCARCFNFRNEDGCPSCDSPQDAVAALSEMIEKHGPHTACKRCGGVWRGTLPSCPSCDRPQFKPLIPIEVETLRTLPPMMAKELSLAVRRGPSTPPPGTYYGIMSDGLGEEAVAPEPDMVVGVTLPEARLVRSPERPRGPVMGDHDPEWQRLVSWAKRAWAWVRSRLR